MSSREREIGQLFTLGFPGYSVEPELRDLAAQIQPGGFILFKRNVSDPAGIRHLTDQLQTLTQDYPAFIAVDQEGGTVARLRKPFTEFPGNRALLDAYKHEKSTRSAKQQARIFAKELRMTGFNWDYAPVLDVDSNPSNPVIGKRAYSPDPDEVIMLGLAFSRALEENGVLSCGKHVPGHGNTSLDSHLDLPVEETKLDVLRKREFKPFVAYAEAGLASLMTAHVVFTALDVHKPATLSQPVITDYVRGEMGFKGIIVTDDLEMKAIDDRYGIEDSTVQTIVAGCDAVLICHTADKQRRAFKALVAEDKKSRIVSKNIDEALGRIVKAKKKLTSPPPFALDQIGHADSLRFADELANYSAARPTVDPTEYKA